MRVARQQDGRCWLEIFLLVRQVAHAGYHAVVIGIDRNDMRVRNDLQISCRHRLRDRGHGGRVLCIYRAATAIAEAMVVAGTLFAA